MVTSKRSAGSPRPFEIDTSADVSFIGPLPNRALPVWCGPLPDELFSSWLVRLAWLNAEKLHTFKRRFWRQKGSPWGYNLDLALSEDALARVASMAQVAPEVLAAHTLWPYLGRLFENVDQVGAGRGLLLGKHRGQRVLGFGLQMCPDCLRADSIPYFRRGWKVAYLVACPLHGRLLEDACPNCHRPIAYHLADFGKALLPERVPTAFCASCGHSWASNTAIWEQVPDAFLEWQERLQSALETGWIESRQAGPIYALSFFEGLRVLIRLLTAKGRLGCLRDIVAREIGFLPFGVTSDGNRNHFCGLRLGERFYILRYAHWLLEEWPERFIWACKAANLAFSYIESYRDRAPMPYWVASVAALARDFRHSKISNEERECVKCFLSSRGILASANQIGRWMGRWYVKRH